MTDVILRCQERVDAVNDGLIARAEWCRLISDAYSATVYQIVAEMCREYFEYTTTLTSDGTNVLSEPADMLSLVEMSYLLTGTTDGLRRDLRMLEAQYRSRMSGLTGHATHYAFVDDKIYLYPTPPANDVFELRYIGQSPELTEFYEDQSVLVDVVTGLGMELLIWAVAVKAIAKQEGDPSLALRERDAIKTDFAESAELREILLGHRRIIDKGGMLEGFGGLGYSDDADWWRNPP